MEIKIHNNAYAFEARPYVEDATVEEIQALRDRVYIYDDQVIIYKEIQITSGFSVNICFDQFDKLSKQIGKCGLVIDISETKRPDAKTRRIINSRFKKMCKDVDHVAFCTGKNILMNTAIKFVMFQTNLNSFSVNKSVEEAVVAVKKIVNA